MCREDRCYCEAASYFRDNIEFGRYLARIKMFEVCAENPTNSAFEKGQILNAGETVTKVTQICRKYDSEELKLCNVGQVCKGTLSTSECFDPLPAAKETTKTLVKSPDGMFRAVQTPGKGPGYSSVLCGRGQTLVESQDEVYCMGSEYPLLIGKDEFCPNTGSGGCLCGYFEARGNKRYSQKCLAGQRCILNKSQKGDLSLDCKSIYDYVYCGGPGACKCTAFKPGPSHAAYCNYATSDYVTKVPQGKEVLEKWDIPKYYRKTKYSEEFEEILKSGRQLKSGVEPHAAIKV
jgi:hypothetical protein